MRIPYQDLSPEALQSLIESYVLREGTDYGQSEHSLKDKVAAVHAQLQSGEVTIVYSELHETVDIHVV